ncbi:hypothetical protein GRX03_00650 [Halovenus sp. WSH3]|uniref:Uncharacterized protein n=1 Tax=Halovenus carboxidivorans TaxID=2692199 RepID=A0A6B0TAA6_9EURY|nr:hypothetical protein [Halovenus carboxidivorans]MXR50119.1 hypothetical protein [Halovenus carboxidivorans]
MFSTRELSAAVEAVRDEHAPGALVLDCAHDFETVPPAQAEELGLLVDSLDPASYPAEWLPADAPEVLVTYASSDLTVGMPGDGGVAWTRQTEPPVVLCKPRLDGSPDSFVDFLIAEALVEVGLDEPEHMLGFFGAEYPNFADAVRPSLDPVGTYQLAVACYDAYLGLQTREIFAEWDGPLFEAWLDAGDRLSGRVEELPTAIATGELSVPEAAELACNAIKHAGELPAPFDALDASAYLDHGASYAVEWAERVAETISG